MSSDMFPEELDALFHVPEGLDDDLRPAIERLAGDFKADLVATGAPAEVIMDASVCLNQFAKHMQASRQPYGHTELGAYSDPASERAALSSLHNGIAGHRDAMAKMRVSRANPAQVRAAIEEHTDKFRRVCEVLWKACAVQTDALRGDELLFWVQGSMIPAMQEEGLMEE